MKRLLITGSEGFIGKNLLSTLIQRNDLAWNTYDHKDNPQSLPQLLSQADEVIHLAGVNRPKNEEEFQTGNVDLTKDMVRHLFAQNKSIPILIPSSIQAVLDNPYGKSKQAAEDILFAYAQDTGARVYVYRLPNVFGKWGRPNYNSAVATFCHNVARGLPICVNDANAIMSLVHIDDVVDAFIAAIDGKPNRSGMYCLVEPVYNKRLGEIADLIQSFHKGRENLSTPDMSDPFVAKLFSTYLSYVPINNFGYPLKMNLDARGSFTEFIKSDRAGQISVNVSRPGITKGDHWHRTKHEKFLVVAGAGVIRFRNMASGEHIEYRVSSRRLEVVDIPAGYTHNITNTGDTDMVTIMWANEPYNPASADTYFEAVDKEN